MKYYDIKFKAQIDNPEIKLPLANYTLQEVASVIIYNIEHYGYDVISIELMEVKYE